MPLQLNWFERQIYLKRNWGPGPILDFFSPLAFKALYAAYKMDIFELIENEGPLSAKAINEKLDANEDCLTVLLETLYSLGYLERKKNSIYKNAALTKRWMLKNSEFCLGDMLGFFNDSFIRWDYLNESIISGRPYVRGDIWMNTHSGSWTNYHLNLRAVSRLLSKEMVNKTKIKYNSPRLIDIGGSHGYYSVQYCKRYPDMSAVIFDTHEARLIAEETIRQHNMENRIQFKEGDILTDDPGNDYDIALLFNTLRIFPDQNARKVLDITYRILKKGGTIFIADQFCSTPMKRSFYQTNVLLIVLELINTSMGKPYSADEVIKMLKETGFTMIKEIILNRSPGISIIKAVK